MPQWARIREVCRRKGRFPRYVMLEKVKDFGWRAVHDMTVQAKESDQGEVYCAQIK